MVPRRGSMTMLLTAYFACAFGFSKSEIDWSPFDVIETLRPADSKDIIKLLPIQQYWDVQKGSFRTGIIGETLNLSFPEFVSTVEMKVSKGGKLVSVDSSVVDTAALFMHGLSALSYLTQLDAVVHDSAHVSPPSGSGVVDFQHIREDAFRSTEELAVMQEALRTQISRADIVQQTEEQLHHLRRSILQAKSDATTEELHRQQELKLRAAAEHSQQLFATTAARFQALSETVQDSEASLRRQKQLHAEEQHAAAVASLRSQVALTMEALTFRAAEELKVALQQQEFEETQLLATKSELLQGEVEEVINTFFSELRGCVQVLVDNPAVTLTALQYAVAAVIVMLTLLELVQLVLAVVRKISGASYLPQVVALSSSNARLSAEAGHTRRWPEQVSAQLDLARAAFTASVAHGLPLPIVLVSGPSGSGKSAVQELLIQHVLAASARAAQRFSLLRVCGADLQALGNAEATQFLNDLVRSYSVSSVARGGGALLLVIDDADCIVAARGCAAPEREARSEDGAAPARSTSGCLFALLTGLRGNSARIAVVLGTRLQLQGAQAEVDEALLDRVDLSVVLPLPDELQRLHCAAEALGKLRGKTLRSPAMESEWGVLEGFGAEGTCQDEETMCRMMSAVRGAVLSARLLSAIAAAAAGPSSVSAPVAAAVSACPETDTPAEGEGAGTAEGSATATATATATVAALAADRAAAGLLAELRGALADFPDDALDLRLCLRVMLAVSGRWSFRDLKQYFSALNYAIMCSDRSQLSTRIWMQELVYTFD